MPKQIQGWVGKPVKLTLRSTMPVTLDGTLLSVDESGALLEQVKGQVFIPTTSILHLCVVDAKKKK